MKGQIESFQMFAKHISDNTSYNDTHLHQGNIQTSVHTGIQRALQLISISHACTIYSKHDIHTLICKYKEILMALK